MLANGLEEEVKTLFHRGYHPELISMKGLGYQQFMNVCLNKVTRDEAITLLKRDTKRFAKRQFTWFRREPAARWIDITGITQPAGIVERIKKSV
jgi:tRNA dimethylallyltransferase